MKEDYAGKRSTIEKRLSEFKRLYLKGSEEDIFAELVFCILTPQSRAKLCWDAVVRLRRNGLLLKGSAARVERALSGVRFKKKKSGYIVRARKLFVDNAKVRVRPLLEAQGGVYERRHWLVENVCGLGYKEASHFLRNVGFGERIAILDRHILKNLKEARVMKDVPESISKARYFEIEKKMAEFARRIKIPLAHLDLLFWSKETGEVFK